MRSTTNRKPSASKWPTSPVCSHPSLTVAAVCLRRLPVARHHRRAPDADLAVLAGGQLTALEVENLHLNVDHRFTHRAGPSRPPARRGDERRTLGEPVPSSTIDDGTRRSHSAMIAGGSGAPPDVDDPQVGQSRSSSGVAISICSIDGTTDMTSTWCCSASPGRIPVEPALQHRTRRPVGEHPGHRHQQPVSVRERQRGQQAVEILTAALAGQRGVHPVP